MLLGELLETGDLGLRPLVLPSGAERRAIVDVYTTDLTDPGRYLTGGELVLTGLVWWSAEAAAGFVDALVDSGATALGAGEAALGGVPDELTDVCRRRGLPLFAVPASLSFAEITRRVLAGNAPARPVGRRLLAVLAGRAGLNRLLDVAAAELGEPCAVLSPVAGVIAGAPPPERAALVHAVLTAPRLPASVTVAGRRIRLLPADAPDRHRTVAWFVACPAELADAMVLAEELAGLVALERARVDAGRRAERRLADQVLRALTAGGDAAAELLPALRVAGIGPGTPVTVLVSDGELGVAVLDEVLRTAVPDPVVGVRGGTTLAVVPSRDLTADQLADAVRAGYAAVAAGLGGARLPTGVSGTVAAGPALFAALEEARHAAGLAAARSEAAAVVTADEIDSHMLLLGSVPDEVRRAYRNRVLGPVLAYDSTHDAELVATLTAFLDHAGSWSRCAEVLHLHVNTVRYRIAKVEQLTGRNLGRLDDRVDLFLALRLG
ncbi:PucR family transcriptional regulator [Cryptosporangium aurantiacum]|uniref:Purine catabolism regulatory protein-like family protein n=1 Tax=Cryptosporangium aurantiacum TaxID=134849 RepID=A0A1M7QCE6_9ACTN|nr:PucR family transcriptional regulator ligand-binding domain-containing protein [Cryptosporangium aurantiacum]SHN28516.1 Purine catabolism regulatory protein-like family protein [Cryptosporangium aurantiacum]